jgi:hypothetical protein
MRAVIGPKVGGLYIERRDVWQDLVSMTPRLRGIMLDPNVCLWNSQLGRRIHGLRQQGFDIGHDIW